MNGKTSQNASTAQWKRRPPQMLKDAVQIQVDSYQRFNSLCESISRGLVCAHMHSIARTQKILTKTTTNKQNKTKQNTKTPTTTKTNNPPPQKKNNNNINNNKHPSMRHPRRLDVTSSMVGLKKERSHTQKSHPKMVNPRGIAGHAEEEDTSDLKTGIQAATLRDTWQYGGPYQD